MPEYTSSCFETEFTKGVAERPLRVLFAHNRYRSRGGEDESRDHEMHILRSRGHQVFEYLVDNREIPASNYLSAGIQSIWNADQHRRLGDMMREVRPDVLKVDNYFPILSPSVFSAAKAMGIATVLSVRNYRLICPGASLFRDGKICDNCVGSKLALSAIRHRCYRQSYLQTAAVVLSNGFSGLNGTWKDSVDQYIAVSDFVKRELVRGGYPEHKIAVKGNSIVDTGVGDGSGDYALYVGRLIPEKGIATLLAGWRTIGNVLPLKIIGQGSLEADVVRASQANPAVHYLGRKTISEVCDYMGRATVLIFPSEWYEPFGRSIVEAYSKGTPVIGADTEPMRDMIQVGQTGLFYRAGDSDNLATTVLKFIEDRSRISFMRQQARSRYLKSHSPEKNYGQMMTIFREAMSVQRSVSR